MKINYFITHFPYRSKIVDENYAVGGAEVVVDNLTRILAQKGHKISIFTISADSKSEIEEYNDGRKVYRYGTNFRVASGNFSFKLLKNSVKYSTDIVHVHISVPTGDIAGFLYAKRKKKPLIVTTHLDKGSYKGVIIKSAYYLYSKLITTLLSQADIIISPSKYYIKESRFLEKYKNKVVVIPNGINVEDFNVQCSKEKCREKLAFSSSERILLCVGNLEPRKGLDILLKAMPKILRNIQDVKLVVVGNGIMNDKLKNLAERLGIFKHIKFAGFIDEELKPFYYKSADIFVLPSLYEIFGIVNLEAMACSVPIVASKIGGVPDVVKNGENGVLVPPKDEEALAEAIIYLLENEEVRRGMGRNGRKKVEDYSWERIAEETEKVYEKVLNI